MWLKKLKYFLISVLTATLVITYMPHHRLDGDLYSFVDRYMFFVDTSCTKDQYWMPNQTSIKFGKLEGYTIGECEYNYPYEFKITIDPKFWGRANSEERYQLIAHEMRHCLFRVDHSPDSNNYMYYDFPTIDMQTLDRQVMDDLELSCKRN